MYTTGVITLSRLFERAYEFPDLRKSLSGSISAFVTTLLYPFGESVTSDECKVPNLYAESVNNLVLCKYELTHSS